ncbi:spinster family MFS transporter [Sphingomonas sp. YL-JM2C]
MVIRSLSVSETAATPVSYRYWVLAILTVGLALSFVDRTVLSSIGEAVRVEFALTNTQFGFLQGPAFVVLYLAMCIPISRLAERYNRVVIVSISVGIWSLFTTLSGVAGSFVLLCLLRMGVGLGEAGSGPASQSIISDYFPPHQRARALSIYYLGMPIGILAGALFGGFATQYLSWRWAFVILGVPGLLLPLVMLATVREPGRGASDAADVDADHRPGFVETACYLFGVPAFRHLLMGTIVASFATYGLSAFTAPFLIRRFDFDYAQVGLFYGLVTGASYSAGLMLGGYMAPALARRDARWYGWLPAIGVALAALCYGLSFQQTRAAAMLPLLFFAGAFHFVYVGPTNGITQNLVSPRMRATTAAILFVSINIVAITLGPPVTGYLIDHLSATAYGVAGQAAYQQACTALTVSAACKKALAEGTSWSLIVISMFFLWSAAHFLMASRTVEHDLRRAHRS